MSEELVGFDPLGHRFDQLDRSLVHQHGSILKGLGIQGLGQAFFAEFAIHPRLSVIPSVSLLKSSVALDTRVYLSPVTDPWRKFFTLRTSSRKNMSLSTGVKVWGCVTLMGGVYTPVCNEAYKPFVSIGVELL